MDINEKENYLALKMCKNKWKNCPIQQYSEINGTLVNQKRNQCLCDVRRVREIKQKEKGEP